MSLMKTYKIYLTTFVTLISLSGCLNLQPEAEVEEPAVQEVIAPKVEPIVKVDPTFHAENLIKNDSTNRVFLNCFKTGHVNLQKSCQKQINTFLKAVPLKHKRKIIIEVHTDKGGSFKNNLSISKKRAKYVASSLYYKEYKNSKVYYNGFGESKLIYDAENKKANIENRRVVIKVREKNFKMKKSEYILYKKAQKTLKKATQKVIKKVTKLKPTLEKKVIAPVAVVSEPIIKNVKILNYTGPADTGWIYFGKRSLKEKFKISCVDDKPRKVKRRAISKSKKSEFTRGLYDKRISGDVGEDYLEVYPVYVFENGKLPITNPILTYYGDQRNILRYQTTVNAYRGRKGILYRIFVNGKKDVKCMDLVIPYKSDKVSYGRVYMQKEGKIKTLKFKPE